MTRIVPKTPAQLAKMRRAGQIVAEVLELVRLEARPWVTTQKLDRISEELIVARGGTPAFKGYRGYPAAICTSVNEQVVHGIPGPRELQEGDVLSVDVGVFFDGYAGDAAITLEIGECSPEARRLIECTRRSLDAALQVVKTGALVSDIGRAVQETARSAGFAVVRKYTGHGIGSAIHEPPQVPNFVSYWPGGSGPELPCGATIAIEPMLNAGTHRVEVLADGWTVVTKDGKLSAHFEHTVSVEDYGPVILTTL